MVAPGPGVFYGCIEYNSLHTSQTAYMWGVLDVVVVNIVVRSWRPSNGLEGLLERQFFVCDVAAFLDHQLFELMLIASGHSVQCFAINGCHETMSTVVILYGLRGLPMTSLLTWK